MSARRRLAALLLAVLPGLLPGAGAAQLAAPHVRALGVEARPGGTVVAVTVGVPSGSAQDPDDEEGTAYLLAHSLARMADSILGDRSGAVRVDVGRERTLFTHLAPPERWRESLWVISSVLFQLPVEEWALEEAREDLLRDFGFEAGAPVREFEEETYRTLTSALDPWALPPRGFLHTVRNVDRSDLRRFHRTRYTADRAAVALVGPLDEEDAVEAAPASVAMSPVGVLAGRPPEHAGRDGRRGRLTWLAGDRLSLVREITNAWIAVGLPAPREASRTELEVLARVLEERLNPATPQAGIYRAEVRLEDSPDGPIVLVLAATAPESADRWEREILDAVRSLSEREPHPSFMRAWRERTRSAHALEEMLPEGRSSRMVRDLLREGRVRDADAELDALTPADLHALARSLGEPRVLVLGPDLNGDR